MKELVKIQAELKAPKNQRNNFGKYNYRSCEDILEAVKPLANENGCFVLIEDQIELIGDRYYIKATATITNGEQSVKVSAYARESLTKKGMDDAQITGATSSYARKYALNGLFAIDDTKDADATNNHKSKPKAPTIKALTKAEFVSSYMALNSATTFDELGKAWIGLSADAKRDPKLIALKEKRKVELGGK
jgi:hypothetical protein